VAQHNHTRSNIVALLRARPRRVRRYWRFEAKFWTVAEEGGRCDVGAKRISVAVRVRVRTE
jgi:hypothetical protein